MKSGLKKGMIPALSLAAAVAIATPGYAADNREKIEEVQIDLEWDAEPAAYEDIGSITATVASDEVYEISEAAEYYDTNDDEWERGETPVVRLEVSVKSAYLNDYKFTSSTDVDPDGCHSKYKSKKVLDDGSTLRIDLKLRKVSGELPDIEDARWDDDDTVAAWDSLDDADKYEVKLYRNGVTVTTITTNNNEFDFYPYMNRSGDYTFKVRGICNSDDERSDWSDESEDLYISSRDVYTGAAPTTNYYMNTSGGSSHGGPASGYSGTHNPGWVQDAIGWTFWQNGQALKDTWLFVDNNWFYLGSNHYMMTGWIYVDNNWFHLNTVSDGTKGAMLSGWQNIGGVIYYLNPISDGTKGAMKTGYQTIDGKNYYFDTSNGSLWMNRTVPDGRWADSQGVIH